MTWGATSADWTPERRKKQSEAVHRWKLWQSSTGPTSVSGKAKVSMNGLRHGRRSASVHSAGAVTACIDKLARELDE